MITVARAEKLRAFVNALADDLSEAEDLLATLEDSDVKGGEREEAQEMFVSFVNNVGAELAGLTAAMEKML